MTIIFYLSSIEFGESGTSFKDIDGLIGASWVTCRLPIPHDEENEAAKFLRLFNASLFVNGCDPEFVCGPFQLLTECVEGDDEINPFPLNFPREVSEWAFIKEYVVVM